MQVWKWKVPQVQIGNRLECKLQTANSKMQIKKCKSKNANLKMQMKKCKLENANCKLKNANCKFKIRPADNANKWSKTRKDRVTIGDGYLTMLAGLTIDKSVSIMNLYRMIHIDIELSNRKSNKCLQNCNYWRLRSCDYVKRSNNYYSWLYNHVLD